MGNGLPIYPILDLRTSKGWWVQSQWCAGETPINLLPMNLTCANANNLSGWVHFLCFKRKPKDQYDEEALIA
jgi:hypothetical protein